MSSTPRRVAQCTRVFLVGIAAACGSGETPPPASAARKIVVDPAPPPPRTLSRFDVPLDYDFTPVLAIVERAVPRTFGSLDSVHVVPGDDRKHYAFTATRDDFKAFVSGQHVHLRTTISYRARVFYKPPLSPTLSAGCGNEHEQPRIVIELVTPLSLGPDWHLRSSASIGMLEPASARARDRCTVSIFSYDLTERIVEAARAALTSRLPDIDRRIGDVDLTPHAKEWWTTLNQPIRLASGVWLLLRPMQLRLGDVTGNGHVLTIRAGLDAYPTIITGAPPHPPVPALPPLARRTTSGGFQILLEGNVDYFTASQALGAALTGKIVAQTGRSVIVQSALVRPDSGGRISLELGFTGDATGRLRLVGTPRYSATSGMIEVPDLAYDLTTDDNLINAYTWLRSDVVLTTLRAKTRVPIAPVLGQGKSLLLDGLNRTIGGVMTIKSTVDSVAVDGLYVTKAGLLVRAHAFGNSRVAVRRQTR